MTKRVHYYGARTVISAGQWKKPDDLLPSENWKMGSKRGKHYLKAMAKVKAKVEARSHKRQRTTER